MTRQSLSTEKNFVIIQPDAIKKCDRGNFARRSLISDGMENPFVRAERSIRARQPLFVKKAEIYRRRLAKNVAERVEIV